MSSIVTGNIMDCAQTVLDERGWRGKHLLFRQGNRDAMHSVIAFEDDGRDAMTDCLARTAIRSVPFFCLARERWIEIDGGDGQRHV